MINATTEIIREIAEQLDCGFRVFIHRTTGRMLFVPEEDSILDEGMDAWNEALEELESNASDYYEVDKWTSREAFEAMQWFADQVTDPRLRGRLTGALERKKPFREFKQVIVGTMDARQQWFDYKGKWQQDFVARQLSWVEDADE